MASLIGARKPHILTADIGGTRSRFARGRGEGNIGEIVNIRYPHGL